MSGAVVWFTGLPSSGKSTLAQRVLARLRADGIAAAMLDGDEIRDALVPKPGYTPDERDAFYATLARLAAMLSRQGLVVLVAATANRRAYRERARGLAPRFLEVFVDVPADECRRRDAKGLYASAVRGATKDMPGADAGYEPPEKPDVRAFGGEDELAVDRVLPLLSADPAQV